MISKNTYDTIVLTIAGYLFVNELAHGGGIATGIGAAIIPATIGYLGRLKFFKEDKK